MTATSLQPFNQTYFLTRLTRGLDPPHAAWISRRLPREWSDVRLDVRPSCLKAHRTGAARLEDGPPPSHAKQHAVAASSAEAIAVVLFDDRAEPHLQTMSTLYEAVRNVSQDHDDQVRSAVRLEFHAVLAQPLSLPGVRVTALASLPDHVRCVHAGLARLVGRRSKLRGVLYKTMLHWILPSDVSRVVVLDTDLVPLRPLTRLRREFAAMRRTGALFGAVPEQNIFYSRGDNQPPGVAGYNTGVWLQDLEAMRSSRRYSICRPGSHMHARGWRGAGGAGGNNGRIAVPVAD